MSIKPIPAHVTARTALRSLSTGENLRDILLKKQKENAEPHFLDCKVFVAEPVCIGDWLPQSRASMVVEVAAARNSKQTSNQQMRLPSSYSLGRSDSLYDL